MLKTKFQSMGQYIYGNLVRGWSWLQETLWPFIKTTSLNLYRFLKPRYKRYLLWLMLLSIIFVGAFTGYVFIRYQLQKDEISQRLDREKEWLYGRGVNPAKPPIKIYDRQRRLIGEYLPERGSHMTMQVCQRMQWLPKAAVSSEDRYFFEHGGISYMGIARAVLNNLRSLSLREGGGTITQQLARNLFTDRARTFYRKLYESFVAHLIEGQMSKDEILCLYLNKIYMGEGRIGAEEASWFYFRKPPYRLQAAEAAMIVGLFPSPVRYSPLNNIKLSLQKQRSVMDALVRDKHLDDKKKLILQQQFMHKYEVQQSSDTDAGEIGRYGASRDFRFNVAPAANAYVKDYLYKNLSEEQIIQGGLKVFTTIDKDRQQVALATVRDTVRLLRSEMMAKSPKVDPKKLRKLARRINGVLVSIDPKSAEILALVGGYAISEGNMTYRPFEMRRQPGSSMKGFLYAVAIDEGVRDVNSMVLDKRFRQGRWSPRNWNGKYLGEIPLRQALAISSNSVAVRTLDELGAGIFRRRILSAIESQDGSRIPTNLTLALGSAELSPVELASIYGLVNNGGLVVAPYLVVSIEDANGDYLIPPSEELRVGPALLSAESCHKAVKLMSYVFDPEQPGTASFIGQRRQKNEQYLNFDIAGKTGTVQLSSQTRKKFGGVYGTQKDAWFVGLVPGETTVVWFGQDEGAPISRGSGIAASVWASYADQALRGKVQGRFEPIEIIDPLPEKEQEENWFDSIFEDQKPDETEPKQNPAVETERPDVDTKDKQEAPTNQTLQTNEQTNPTQDPNTE